MEESGAATRWKKVPTGGPHLSATQERRTCLSAKKMRGGHWRSAAGLVQQWAGRAPGPPRQKEQKGGKKAGHGGGKEFWAEPESEGEK